jgi:hypothetical protein
MRSSVRSRLAPPIGVGIGRIGSSEWRVAPGSRLPLPLAFGHSLSGGTSDTIEFRLAHRAGRLREAAATSDGHPSWFFRILLSDIVKRKHIRSNRMVKKLERRAVRVVLRWIDEKRRGRKSSSVLCRPFSVIRLEHLSRGPRLTARLPDVFEAKLVFSTGRALPSALSVYAEGIRKTEFGNGHDESSSVSVLGRLSSDTLLGYENNQVS